MKYRKISPCIWNDAKVRELSDKGKLALLFLLTHPHMTPLGAIRANAPGLACELGWSEKVFRKAFGEVLALGIAKEDAKAPLVWFPNFLRHNMPESPNVVRSWVGAFRDLPESPLKGAMLERTGEAVRTLGEGFRSAFAEAFPGVLGRAAPGVSASRPGNLAGAPSEALPIPFGEAFPEGMPNQEQEQEQRRKGGRGTRAGGAIRDGGGRGFPVWRARSSGRGLRLRRKRFAGRKPAGWGPCGRALAGEISIGRMPTGGRRCGGDAPARRTASLRGALGFASVPASGPVPGWASGRTPGWASGAPKGGAAFPLVGLLSGRASPGRAPAAGGVPVLLVGVSRAAGAGGRMARVAAALGAPGASRTLRRAGGHPAHAGRGHALEAGQDPQDGEMAGRDGLE